MKILETVLEDGGPTNDLTSIAPIIDLRNLRFSLILCREVGFILYFEVS